MKNTIDKLLSFSLGVSDLVSAVTTIKRESETLGLERYIVGTHRRGSHHNKGLLPAEQERVLVDHGLDDVFEVRPRHLEAAHVGELHRQKRRPPAYGQVLAVHGVQLRVVRHPERTEIDTDEKIKSYVRIETEPLIH